MRRKRAAQERAKRAERAAGASGRAGGPQRDKSPRTADTQNDDQTNNHYSLHFIDDLCERYCIFPLVVINPTNLLGNIARPTAQNDIRFIIRWSDIPQYYLLGTVHVVSDMFTFTAVCDAKFIVWRFPTIQLHFIAYFIESFVFRDITTEIWYKHNAIKFCFNPIWRKHC